MSMYTKIEVDVYDVIDTLSDSEKEDLARELAEKYLDTVELTLIAVDSGEVNDILDTPDEEDIVKYLRSRGYKVEEE